jgi:hypothetical protein
MAANHHQMGRSLRPSLCESGLLDSMTFKGSGSQKTLHAVQHANATLCYG